MQFNIHFPATEKSVQGLACGLLLLLSSCATLLPPEARWDPLIADGASSELGLSRTISSDSPALVSLLAQADSAIEQQQWASALASLERAQRIDSKQSAVWSRLAVVYLARQDPEQAIQMARKSNSHARGDASVLAYNWLLMSRAWLQLNQLDQAKAAQQKSQQYLQR